MKELNLLSNYQKKKIKRFVGKGIRNINHRIIASEREKDFFDGGRKDGYGGFNYNEKYWTNVVKDFKEYWNLDSKSKVLDVGCAKGFMLYDLIKLIPGIQVKGLDISNYAIKNSMEDVKKNLIVGNAKNLPFEDNEFDVVISINSIHNLDIEDCGKSLREIERVSKKNSFITVDAYSNDIEKKRMEAWNLTGKTIMSVDEWKKFFKENNYTGDYYWFIP